LRSGRIAAAAAFELEKIPSILPVARAVLFNDVSTTTTFEPRDEQREQAALPVVKVYVPAAHAVQLAWPVAL
jgi:hypothetical protein